jgi:PTS system mannose-specific IID component
MPFCSLVALTVFGLGGDPWTVVLTFLLLYNVVHVGIRIWGLNTGWNHGLRVATALGNPILRQGPPYVARAAALAAGIGLPLAIGRIIGSSHRYTGVVVAAAILGGAVVVALQNKIDGWRLTLLVLAIFAVVAMVR